MNKQHYLLYGWHLSYFTGKALCYLRYKKVPFTLEPVGFFTLTKTIKKKTGAAVMPVLKTPQGEWVQDTSVIIDHIEGIYPENPVLPNTPVQRFASLLLEAWGDEWWVPIAMHTRWNHPENFALFEQDAGKALMPWAPAFIQRKIAQRPARMLRGMLPHVGIVPHQYKTMDAWTHHMLDALDAHFSQHLFLLGQRPSLGDFGLVGTMYGHLGRDPWPKRELIEPRKHLAQWLERMKEPAQYAEGNLTENDRLPDSLTPVFESIFQEFIPMVERIGQQTANAAKKLGIGTRLPRRIGQVTTTMLGQPFTRGSLPYMVWMMQRVMDEYESMPKADQEKVQEWLYSHGAGHVLHMKLPRVKRMALTVAVESLNEPAEKAA